MMRRCALAPLALAACSATIEVETPPFSQSVEVKSAGAPTYVEVAIDLPLESARGDLVVESASATLEAVNSSRATPMHLAIALSTHGTARPGAPVTYGPPDLPPQFSAATRLLGPKTYAASTRTEEFVDAPGLAEVMGESRIWLILSNSVDAVGEGDALPLRLDLERIVVRAVLRKSLEGLGGGSGIAGL